MRSFNHVSFHGTTDQQQQQRHGEGKRGEGVQWGNGVHNGANVAQTFEQLRLILFIIRV